MKITPDYKGRNDEYDDNTVRFYEKIDEEGYFYELYVMIDNIKSVIIVTESGVSIDYRDGEKVGGSMHTNIIPERLFPGQKELNWDHLYKIIKIIEATDGEGVFYNQEEMDAQYKTWLRLN